MTAATRITGELLRSMPLPNPADRASGAVDKKARGGVLVIAGSVEVPGAALLAATSALRAGAGKLQIATCSSVAPHMGLAVPEALVIGLPETPAGGISPDAADVLCERAERNDAVLVGPGMMDKDAVAALTTELVKRFADPVLVLDAEALVCLDGLREPLLRRQGRTIITPHSGEMASLLGIERDEVEADPIRVAHRVATEFGMVVVMKGECTHILDPDGECWAFESDNAGLATSGSGDTLAGIVTGLAARGATPAQAAIWGVFMHGQAGRRLAHSRGPLGFLARELPGEIPGIMAEFSR
ncbi:carbohydrate kinase [Skermanella stibiiresistens SB22]|uniref:ADP-dependent (S)-NAD(P)H-hydrate dehydratase n=1 Tax=Skermanella stibiiresistens SB22 TaxID=1385369 RepID=W9H435_9PROT|nr:NAD(P)H-hydrate dehydratase [Skermanella stibiiresistens]EWY38523.1 carbohydrate kinase [Skermanella stibiiresistens SB22]